MAEWGEITRILEMTRLTPAGEIQKYYRHTVSSAGGVTFSVDIEEKDMTTDKAKEILAARARQMDEIKAL